MSLNSLIPVNDIDITAPLTHPENEFYAEEKATQLQVSPVIYIQPVNSPFLSPLEYSLNSSIKRVIDIAGSLLFILTILSWLTPLLAIIIKLNSKGQVFFFQQRHKKDGQTFTCIKFRSMYQNAGHNTEHYDHLITPVGKIIRKYHIDELPQLINVLLGDMSLVGPRPYMISENENFEKLLKNYRFRHLVKPGITGLAQSKGFFGTTSNIEKMEDRLEYDLQYIQKWSFFLDIKIMMNTFLITTGLRKKYIPLETEV
ncbi:MAG: hypothetical protein JWN76_1096 [Chitinophagaceae bacterium]|nr:hypothetical protein [Chitinophagaceae bacterium]